MAYFSRPQSSAAVRIVNPNSTQDDAKSSPNRKDSVQRQCRNVMIYGSCKFQDKGCVYSHPRILPLTGDDPVRAASPAIGSPLTARAVNAPVFVPKSTSAMSLADTPASPPPLTARSSLTSPSPPSPSPQPVFQDYQEYPADDSYEYHYNGEMINSMEYYDDQQYDIPYYPGHPEVFVREPLNYHLYTTTIPPAFLSTADSHFVPSSSELRQHLQIRSEIARSAAPPGLGLPEELQGYHTLVPLEAGGSERRKFGSWYSTVYRAVNSTSGIPFALRRIENYRLLHQTAFTPIEAWSRIRHPSIVSVVEAFTTRAFNDSSLVVAYEYHAGAKTLYDTHCKTQTTTFNRALQAVPPQPIAERILWSYIVQIASAIRKVHDAGMPVRMIDISKIIVTGQNRVRIGSCGLVDVLSYDTPQDVHMAQLDDLSMFGRLIISLCCNNASAANGSHFQKSLETMQRLYSADVKNTALFLISKNNPHRNINHFFEIISQRVIAEMDDAMHAADCLEGELLGELENARLVRLLCKFGFINERPEFARDPRWSETGDRYLIKLFRDFVFHQMDEHGNPVTNLSHVLTCLNKLDAGSEEKVMLIARDEQSCLVVSYREIKSCVEAAFNELARTGSNVTKYL